MSCFDGVLMNVKDVRHNVRINLGLLFSSNLEFFAGYQYLQAVSAPYYYMYLTFIYFQTVVLQEYHNDNNDPIEAKFVFPLDDMAAVCGFEAFINGKHIIGK